MSTATSVPETYELEGDDAVRTLRSTGLGQLVKDSVTRFRAADGTSHTRSLAYQVTLALVPGLIAIVGLATVPAGSEAVPDAEHDEFAWWPADVESWPDDADPRLRRMGAFLEAAV
jgi:hypothetical protein